MPDQQGVGRWDLGRAGRTILRIVTVLVAAAAVVVPVLLLSLVPDRTAGLVVFAVGWAAVCGIVLSGYLRTVTRLEIGADGRIEARRPIGTVTLDARHVTRITRPYVARPTFGQERFRRTTIRTADRKLVLESLFPDVPGVADAIRAHNPAVAVEL